MNLLLRDNMRFQLCAVCWIPRTCGSRTDTNNCIIANLSCGVIAKLQKYFLDLCGSGCTEFLDGALSLHK